MRRALGTHAQPGQVNHFLGKLQNLHRWPHVQHEHIPALPHRAGLDDQLGRLGNGHEVTGDARVGDRHRSATLDLLAEQRDDRARRAEDVAEADHGETGLVDLVHTLLVAEKDRCRLVAERLQHHLRQAFGATHHIGRSHRLVGGDQHEVLHADLHRRLHRMQGAHHIVEDPLGNVVLDDGYMLVGCGVIDGVDLPGAHHVDQALWIAHRAEDRQQVHRKRLALDPTLQFLMDAVKIVFAVLEQDQHAGRATQDLPAEFGTDRTARPGHHHHLATDATLEQLLARRHAVAPEQIGDVHLLQVVHLDPAAGQVHEAGHAAHVERERLQGLENLSAPGPGGGRNGQENLLRARLVDHLADMLGGIDPQAGNDPVGDLLVVIDERHRTHRPTETQCRNQLVAGRPRTIDGHPGQTVLAIEKWYRLHSRVPVAHEILAHGQTQAADQQHAQPPVVEHQGTWHRRRRATIPVHYQRQHQSRDGHRLGDGDQCIVTEIAHYRAIHAEANEQWDGDERSGNEEPGMLAENINHVVRAKTHDKCQPQR
ncbi:hypothetical protein PAERUG_P18_London_17_VIM_2_04_10_03768 [Pseudomonas aeruginosa]|nr:hypothetical protein PAERUG_P18_London_17_VIM_2_04_10_03768 [Pseudomonas aeruginosa]CRS16166.1 hypothetical protein PAERUG_P5_London_26_VIM_2_01_09_04659 [Pseudomonas aeruginosa]